VCVCVCACVCVCVCVCVCDDTREASTDERTRERVHPQRDDARENIIGAKIQEDTREDDASEVTPFTSHL
jgi:hypothetical protein